MGYPLSIFSGNYLLMPYACLQQHSLLKDVSRHNGFVVASSNVLFKGTRLTSSIGTQIDQSERFIELILERYIINRFKAQRHLADVMIETEAPFDIEYRDPNLEKILKLSPADLRFIDALIAKVEGSDETEWVGSDQWIR